MTAAEQFYLVTIIASAAVVGVMLGIVGAVHLLVWLDDRRIRGPVADDPQSEYRDAADEVYDQDALGQPLPQWEYELLLAEDLRRSLNEWGKS